MVDEMGFDNTVRVLRKPDGTKVAVIGKIPDYAKEWEEIKQ
jgi:hypothetical protein